MSSDSINLSTDDHKPQVIPEELQETWLREQDELKKKMLLEDTELWQKLKLVCTLSESDSDEDESLNSTDDDRSDRNSSPHKENDTDAEHIEKENDTDAEHIEKENDTDAEHIEKENDTDAEHIEKENVEGTNSVLKYVGGVDISYIKENDEDACIAVVVICMPDLNVVYQCCQSVKVTAPYIPGFLAFREAELARDAFLDLKRKCPEYFPQVILVDGNGLIHPRGFGFACHLGVLLDIPCIGVAKNLYHTDGIERNEEYKQKISELKKAGDLFHLKGTQQGILGAALKTCDSATKPVYVSQGHRCSLETAIWVVMQCSKFRRPEPVRQADMCSREYLRNATSPKEKEEKT